MLGNNKVSHIELLHILADKNEIKISICPLEKLLPKMRVDLEII